MVVAGLLAVLGLGSPSVVVEAPLLTGWRPPPQCLVSATVATPAAVLVGLAAASVAAASVVEAAR